MESSEDDAGTANSASRRESARERDVGQAEDIDATSCFQQNTPEARASCGTPAMSEDNFDGDSVPSPSTQDVNTSTEAILDMIDEIVDGPGAPKRLTFVTRSILDTSNELASTSSSHEVDTVDIDPDTKSQELQEPQLPTPAISAKSDNIEPGVSDTLVECPPHSSTAEIVDTVNLQLQVISSVPESDPTPRLEQSVIQLQPESSLACPQAYNALSSSVEILQDSPSVSECDNLERTIKCVTSSDNCDTVTVESAESTSNDSSVSENKFASVEPQTRSPLRRRLVRPAPSDRRPDSTVSSTDDSHIIDVHTSGQPCSENIAKDVSSSSDAVPIVHGNVKPEEIRNVSEINICKAETSISTPKKIKLIRQKVTPLIHKETAAGIHTVSSVRDQCQSTSSDTLLLDQASSSENSGVISTTKSKTEDLRPETSNEQIISTIEETSNSDERRTDKENEHSIESPSLSATNSEGLDINKVCEGQNKSEIPVRDSCVLESSKDLDRNAKESLDEKTEHSHDLLEGKDAPVQSEVEAVNASETILNVRESENQGTSRISDKIVEKALDYIPLHMNRSSPILQEETVCESIAISTHDSEKVIAVKDDERKVPPIKLTLCSSNFAESCTSQTISEEQSSLNKSNLITQDDSEAIKQVPKLTIKLSSIQSEEMKSPIPKLTIKPLKPPSEDEADIQSDNSQAIPSVTKINIKPIPKPLDKKNDNSSRNIITDEMSKTTIKEPMQSTITKLNIKPILKPPEKIYDVHRKSSSSEISESEYSENDETTSTSDQASASDQGSSDVVPKVTIKLGKPGTESEGKFYTEQNVPKLTIKGIHQNEKDDQDSMSKLKLVISQSEDKQAEKIPKLTIKTVSKSESQPLSPKLTIKPIKAPENVNKEGETSKTFSTNMDIKENTHVPKITIKPITRSDIDTGNKTPKKSIVACDSPEHIPVVTKLNIKPILKPVDEGETSESLDDKVPVVSKLNIKPIVKPKDNEVDSSIDAVPKITKLNIKPLKNPEVDTSEKKDCDELKADTDENSIPVITKLYIKPIIKPAEEDAMKESENQSSEAGNSSDDNADHIPVVTKLNIKPIVKRDEAEDMPQSVISNDQNIPVVTKLNIKPLVKPDENVSPSSPKKEKNLDNMRNCAIPIVTKLNIKPVLKPEEMELNTPKDENAEKPVKNPPLVMKINMKARADSSLGDNVSHNEHACNNLSDNMSLVPKLTIKPVNHTGRDSPRQNTSDKEERQHCKSDSDSFVTEKQSEFAHLNQSPNNCLGELEPASSNDEHCSKVSVEKIQVHEISEQKSEGTKITKRNELLLTVAPSYDSRIENRKIQVHEINDTNPLHVHTIMINTYDTNSEPLKIHSPGKQKVSVQNCTLLKKLLETTKEDLGKRLEDSARIMSNCTFTPGKSASSEGVKNIENSEVHEAKQSTISKVSSEPSHDSDNNSRNLQDSVNHANRMPENLKVPSRDGLLRETNENLTQPLEISISEKITNQTSGQDSPRIILKINKTDHGASAKIITEELVRTDTIQPSSHDNTQEMLNDKQNQKRQIAYNRRKHLEDSPSMPTGKRLRSSRIVENTEKTPIVRRNSGKRPPSTQISPQSKETELSVLETKRLKLGQLLCGNKPSLSTSPVAARVTTSLTKTDVEIKDTSKTVNHTLINNENCSKNGNSKLHNILSNLQAKQAKQMQAMSFSESNCLEVPIIPSEVELNTSVGSDAVERMQNCHPKVQEMIINENSDFRDFGTATEDLSQDPLEVDNLKSAADSTNETFNIPKIVDLTPQPKKRGRPRKLPVSEGPKPLSLPVPALEERPQRSLRLTRERPAILAKPRGGRGRGRGARRHTATPPPDPAPLPSPPEDPSGTIDPTSARIKLPRMTEALDKMPSTCSTPLSSRRRRSSAAEMQLIETPDLKVGLDNSLSKDDDSDMKSPEAGSGRARGGRGRGGRGRTPRGRGRGRGGGRGAVYMKETMGIYGRVCGPATTTVQLFEEETCMMDDNATPAKPAHLLDEDSQSSVKSSTNESNKMKKSKFADLFDSNKVWTAADVKEYTWPPPEKPDVEHQIMMIQEQVAMFLGVKSFKRRYPELKRRTIGGEERDYVLSKAIVTEALCDLGITAVEASEVLDIMLSDYPHKYEEYRSHQRQRQLTEPQESAEVKAEEKVLKVELKLDSKLLESKPDLPKVDPEKTRQDLAAAAIASASEWNARTNLSRRGACADLQALSVLRRRPPPRAPTLHVRPPAGFYPHALLPGQYQHHYVRYTPDQLRYFPLNTVMSAPPAPPSPAHSSSESEGEWGSRSSSSDEDAHPAPKRKKLTKVKRISQNEGAGSSGASEVKAEGEVDTCRVCKLRLEANRKYTHERFLVCANCNAKLHPGCVELGPDTIRKCREYPWQCAECKSCCACRRPQDDDKMLFCDLCDRGFHIYCVGLTEVPQGRWHCVECAVCKSCGARTASGPSSAGASNAGASSAGASGAGAEAEWHHQTRRGPGGHKVYSHSLCTPCARAYRIGRYCPLCERSFIGPKGTMQLVICKLCDRQLHQECVRQAGGRLNVLDYTCGVCRRGGITSRAAAVRLAPRTIATLFMAKRRFNKYAHRQYLASRARPAADADEPDDDAAAD